jgi:hypothetical protein
LIYKLCGYCGIVGLKKVCQGILFIVYDFVKVIITHLKKLVIEGYSAQTSVWLCFPQICENSSHNPTIPTKLINQQLTLCDKSHKATKSHTIPTKSALCPFTYTVYYVIHCPQCITKYDTHFVYFVNFVESVPYSNWLDFLTRPCRTEFTKPIRSTRCDPATRRSPHQFSLFFSFPIKKPHRSGVSVVDRWFNYGYIHLLLYLATSP